jgi:hypothetical protein
LLPLFTDARRQPPLPSAAAFASAFALFACDRTSLHSLGKDRIHFPARLRGLVGPHPPRIETLGRVYDLANSDGLRRMLVAVHHRLKRNKARADGDGLKAAAVEGHESFKGRQRCRARCQQRTLQVQAAEVVAYYHQGVIGHLSEHRLAVPLDVALWRPGEGEEAAAQRLLQRAFAKYPRYCDVAGGEALYGGAPFSNLCLGHGKHALGVVKGDQRLLLQDAQGALAQQPAQARQDRQRTVPYWDADGFTTAEGVRQPLRVVPTVEAVRRRERVAGAWRAQGETAAWYWATTLRKRPLSTRRVWQAGHRRWDEGNDGFNTLSLPWGLDPCFQHTAAAVVNFVSTLFLAYVLLPCFGRRHVKVPLRKKRGALLGPAEELRRSLGPAVRAAWYAQRARAP